MCKRNHIIFTPHSCNQIALISILLADNSTGQNAATAQEKEVGIATSSTDSVDNSEGN